MLGVIINVVMAAAAVLEDGDAAGAAAVGEAVAFQRLAVERLGPAFANQLRDGLLTASLGLDPSLAADNKEEALSSISPSAWIMASRALAINETALGTSRHRRNRFTYTDAAANARCAPHG